MTGTALAVLLTLLSKALLAVSAAPAASGPDQEGHGWRLSSHTCPPPVVPNIAGEAAAVRTCTFRNLYLLGGKAYYVTTGQPPDFKKLGLYLDIWTAEQPLFLASATPERLSVLAALLTNATLEHMQLAYFWRNYQVMINPAFGARCDGNATVPGKSNYYHIVDEYFPLLTVTLCEQFGHCNPYDNRSALQIIDVTPGTQYPCNLHENYPPYLHNMLACLSDTPLRHVGGPYLRGRLTLVDTAWVGLGPRCRGMMPNSGCYRANGVRVPISHEQMASWRQLAHRCFGFPADAVAPLHPVRLLVVDRLYESGRSILNIGTVVKELRRRFSSRQVIIQLEYMEGLTIREQARIFSSATVVVNMHGAAIGNYPFLPRGAVAVHISPFPGRWGASLPFSMVHDMKGITDLEVLDWVQPDMRRVQVVPAIIAEQAGMRAATNELVQNKTFFDHYRATFECPAWLGPRLGHCKLFLSRALTASLPPEEVVRLANTAIARAFQKQQQLWEPAAEFAEVAVDTGRPGLLSVTLGSPGAGEAGSRCGPGAVEEAAATAAAGEASAAEEADVAAAAAGEVAAAAAAGAGEAAAGDAAAGEAAAGEGGAAAPPAAGVAAAGPLAGEAASAGSASSAAVALAQLAAGTGAAHADNRSAGLHHRLFMLPQSEGMLLPALLVAGALFGTGLWLTSQLRHSKVAAARDRTLC